MSLQSGDIIDGQYRLEHLLGEGGMGAVYRATHVDLGQPVAVKVVQMPPGYSNSVQSTFLKRFEREARVAFQLRHDNAVRVLDFGRVDGVPYLVMEHLDGRPLDAVMTRGTPLRPVARLLELGRQLADVLVTMHGQSLVHRDLKPANVILIEERSAEERRVERPVLVDFGLAYLADSETLGRVTQAGETIGTPEYISPEQGGGEATIGPPTDIYALGCMFYEMLTGHVPFEEGSPREIVAKHMFVPPPAVREALSADGGNAETDPPVPDGLADLIDAMLAKEPDERPTAGQVRETLERLLAGDPVRRRGRPKRFLEPRSERAVTSASSQPVPGDGLGTAETVAGPEGAEAPTDAPDEPDDAAEVKPTVGIVGDIATEWRISLGSAGFECRQLQAGSAEEAPAGVDMVFIPDADPDGVAAWTGVGPVLAGCDPSDFQKSTELLQTAAVDVVTKPVDASKLVSKLERAWRRHQRRQS